MFNEILEHNVYSRHQFLNVVLMICLISWFVGTVVKQTCSLVLDHGNSQQKMRAIAYLEKVNGSGSISVSTSISASGKREVELSLPLLQRNNPNDSDDDEIKALLT